MQDPFFSWSALVLGSTATEITGSGNSIRSRMIGASIAHNVSPVVTSFKPIAAAISPARTSLISSRFISCASVRYDQNVHVFDVQSLILYHQS